MISFVPLPSYQGRAAWTESSCKEGAVDLSRRHLAPYSRQYRHHPPRFVAKRRRQTLGVFQLGTRQSRRFKLANMAAQPHLEELPTARQGSQKTHLFLLVSGLAGAAENWEVSKQPTELVPSLSMSARKRTRAKRIA